MKMEASMADDFVRMKHVFDYLVEKQKGNVCYPEGMVKKEKDSLRRYANLYELTGK